MGQSFTRGIPVDTDGNLSANSNGLIPTQKAVKSYVDTKANDYLPLTGGTISGALTSNTFENNGQTTLNGDLAMNGDIITPDSLLITRTSSPSTSEEILRLGISDSDSVLTFGNLTSGDGIFLPTITGVQPTSNTWGLYMMSRCVTDTGTTPLMGFDCRLSSSVVINRPLFAFRNYTTTVMQIIANGNVGIGTTTPTEKLEVNGNIKASGIVSSVQGVGYLAGAGGSVTQLTSRSTTVVLNKICGNITMFSSAQLSDAIITFTLTNSFISATDFVNVQHISATNGGAWSFSVVASNGSCTITIRNISGASITEATPLRFSIIKGAIT